MKVIDTNTAPPEVWRPGVETRMVISALNGATQLCIFEQWVAPGHGAPTHSHPVEEVLTVRDGEAEMWLDDERVIVTAGQSLIVPASRKHGFRNSGNITLHLHAVLASPIFEASRRAQPSRCEDGRRREVRACDLAQRCDHACRWLAAFPALRRGCRSSGAGSGTGRPGRNASVTMIAATHAQFLKLRPRCSAIRPARYTELISNKTARMSMAASSGTALRQV